MIPSRRLALVLSSSTVLALGPACGGDSGASSSDPCGAQDGTVVASSFGQPSSSSDRTDDTFGDYCKYEYAQDYVDVSWPPKAAFDDVAGQTHAAYSDTEVDSTAFLTAQENLTVTGVGDEAYLANLNGIEFVLWARKGDKFTAVQSTYSPKAMLAAYTAVAQMGLSTAP